jgi:uncharacterized protein YbjT (DUF2867 family)
MLVVTTPTGQIGRHVLAQLVAAGEPVRAVARDRTRIEPGLLAEAEVVEGSIDDPATMRKALDGAEAVFWCIPPDSRSPDIWESYLGFWRPFAAALAGSSVRRVVFVSSGGRGRAKNAGPISAIHAVEELIEGTGVHLRALRCGSFMENMLHQIEPLRHRGMFFYPIDGDFAIPTCATRDIGTRAADLLRDRSWTGQAGTGVHGPADLSFNEMARVMSEVLGRPIRYQEVPGAAYKATLVEHGQSEAFAQGLVDMFREIAGGIHAADPRTPESTTPTTFEAWCGDTLKPAIG